MRESSTVVKQKEDQGVWELNWGNGRLRPSGFICSTLEEDERSEINVQARTPTQTRTRLQITFRSRAAYPASSKACSTFLNHYPTNDTKVR